MFKHLTIKNRTTIQFLIEYQQVKSLQEIADVLHISTSSIYRELLRNRYRSSKTRPYGSANLPCPLTRKFPFVCNSCIRKTSCSKERFFYDAYVAHELTLSNRIQPFFHCIHSPRYFSAFSQIEIHLSKSTIQIYLFPLLYL